MFGILRDNSEKILIYSENLLRLITKPQTLFYRAFSWECFKFNMLKIKTHLHYLFFFLFCFSILFTFLGSIVLEFNFFSFCFLLLLSVKQNIFNSKSNNIQWNYKKYARAFRLSLFGGEKNAPIHGPVSNILTVALLELFECFSFFFFSFFAVREDAGSKKQM